MILTIPGPTVIPSNGIVDSLLVNHYAGERFAESVVDILEGKVNPSGKLPETMPMTAFDQKMTVDQFPGINGTSQFSEKLEMGYRFYDAHNITPAYPFGHGLSYTQFKYDRDSLKVADTSSAKSVSIKVKNIGKMKGKEVVQLYLGFPKSAGEPPKLLKGFKKIDLAPGI